MIRGNRAEYYRQHPEQRTENMKFWDYKEDEDDEDEREREDWSRINDIGFLDQFGDS